MSLTHLTGDPVSHGGGEEPWDIFGPLRTRAMAEYRALEAMTLQVLNPRVCEHLMPLQGTDVVDIGCGSGAQAELIVAAKPHRLFAIDNDKEALSIFAQRLGNSADLVHADVRTLEIPIHSFDRALCSMVLMFMDNQEARQLIDKIFSCLRPQGKAVVVVPNAQRARDIDMGLEHFQGVREVSTYLEWIAAAGFSSTMHETVLMPRDASGIYEGLKDAAGNAFFELLVCGRTEKRMGEIP